MSQQPKRKTQTSVDIDEIHENTSTQLITITADKLKLILIEHLSKIESSRAWQAPLGVVITIVLVFCSSTFREAFGVPADTWRAIFMVTGFSSLTWLGVALARIGRSVKVDDVIDIIKNKA